MNIECPIDSAFIDYDEIVSRLNLATSCDDILEIIEELSRANKVLAYIGDTIQNVILEV